MALERGGTWEGALDGETHGQYGHEDFVGHGVDDGADDRLLVPAPGDVAINKICETGVGKEPDSPGMVVVQDEVADDGRGNEAGEGEDVGNGVDVLVRGELGQDFEEWCLGFLG
jgi:hypothetical protein